MFMFMFMYFIQESMTPKYYLLQIAQNDMGFR